MVSICYRPPSQKKECVLVAKTANSILDCNNRDFSCKSREVIFLLYSTLCDTGEVPLRYGVQFWGSYIKKGMDGLEKVQQKVSLHKMLTAQ